MGTTYIHTIDVAHPPLAAHVAEQVLNDALTMVRTSSEYRVLKVIHGKGTNDHPAVLKSVVLNWAYRNKHRMKACIPGEQYTLFDATTQLMRSVCGQIADNDLGASNTGITVLWIR